MSQVHIAQAGNTELRLDSAVLLYRSSNNVVYATAHEIVGTDARPQIGAGRPLTVGELADFADAASARVAYRGFIDPRLLYVAPNTIAWWVPAARRRVWFAADKPIGEASAEASHPALVFVAHGTTWFVFAVRGDARPGLGQALFYAPYFNVWDDGQICTGNVDLPDRPGPESIAAYEAAFFRSRFTHPNNRVRVVRRKGALTQLWADLLTGVDFPNEALVSRKETLADAIQRITERR